ncbi:GNAT family N-acetyltransferase [Neolewinella sp.]|uniref:GNAT family N-acetyltransferase n=1 Tax=Neolewinella sp. TaxID=2993543 RepID=UPI003B51B651
MTTRPGRESDFTHLETFVWQAIFPSFDVPGLTDEQRRENDAMVEGARTRVQEALEQPEYSVFTAWDERRRALAGYLVLEGSPGEYSTITELIVRRSDWGKGVGEALLREAIREVGPYQGMQVAVRGYNARAIAFFAKHGFVDSGESAAGDFAIDRVLMLREAEEVPEVGVALEESPRQTSEASHTKAGVGGPRLKSADEGGTADEALPDYTLTTEDSEPIIDPAESTLDDKQRSELDAFIAMAKAKKQEKKTPVVTDLFSEPVPEETPRHPEVEFEVDFGDAPRQTSEAAQRSADEETAAPPPPALICPNCGETVPETARFCPNCGHRLEEEVLELHDVAPDPPSEEELQPPPSTLTVADLRTAFEDRLGERLTAYFGADRLPDYLAVYRKDETFRQIRDVSIKSLTEYLNRELVPSKAQRRRDNVLAGLVEYFVVETAAELHPGMLPQRLLRYQSVDWTTVDLFKLVMDYLDLDQETETVYTDFITTPARVLRNATRGYLGAGKDERLLLICDQSLLSSGKQGFAFTDSALYWKNLLQPAGVVTYTTLQRVETRGAHLLLDSQYFDAGPGLNLRVAVLLDKLRRIDLRGD